MTGNDNNPNRTLTGRDALKLLCYGVAIWAAIVLSFQVGFATNSVVAVWPAAGICAWVALRYGWYAFPVIFISHVVFSTVTQGDSLVFWITNGGNALGACVAASLYKRFGGPSNPLSSVTGVLLMIGFLGIVLSVIAALIGTLALQQFFELNAVATREMLWRWFFSDFSGVVLVAPVMIALVQERKISFDDVPPIVVTALTLVALYFASRMLPDGLGEYPIVLMTMPLCVWLALRDTQTVSVVLLSLSIFGALLMTLASVGDVSGDSFLAVQLYGIVVMCTSLMLRAITVEKNDALHDLARERILLEQTVAERTTALRAKISDYEAVKKQLEIQALTDTLTGLANRRAFQNFAESQFAVLQRHGVASCLVLIDIDHFKRINDHYGHAAGDDVIVALADLLGSSVRSGTDIAARIGGEEFACLLGHTDLDQTLEFAERLRLAVANLELRHGKETMACTVSIGVAALTEDLPDIEAALQAADEALYDAKRSGRNQVRRFDPSTIRISANR
ncbi:MAG: diguanylate cyclase [Pseudomonadota bacterium]